MMVVLGRNGWRWKILYIGNSDDGVNNAYYNNVDKYIEIKTIGA